MPSTKNTLLFFFTLLSCLSLLSTPSFSDSSPSTNTATLNIGISFAIPPWVITENDSGIELDILKQAFLNTGYTVKPNYLPFALAYSLFDAGKLDGVINAKESALNTGYFSEPVVTFQNVAISLQDKNYPEHIEMSFLVDKSVVAFQKASLLLGDDFKNMILKSSTYQEVAKQSLQINLLMIRNIDFIIMDKSVFGYYWQEAQNDPNLIRAKSKLDRPVRFHYLFEPTPYRFVFKSEKVRDDFNLGLSKLKKNGGYDDIIKRYSHLNDLYTETSINNN